MTADVAAALAGDLDRLRAHPYDSARPFWRAADEQHVDLLLLDLARASGADEAWTAGARGLARSAAVAAAALRGLRDRELRRVLDLLAAAGAPCLVIKGAALAYTVYRQPHLRRRDDADLLVRGEDAERVAALLEAHGYARAAEISGDYATSQMHFDRPDHPDHRDALDIHWRIVNAHAFADAIAFSEFQSACMPVPELGAHAWTLCLPARAGARVHSSRRPPSELGRSALAVGRAPARVGDERRGRGSVRGRGVAVARHAPSARTR